MHEFVIPETPWDLIAAQRNVMRKLWNRDFSLQTPALSLDFPWSFELKGKTYSGFGCFSETRRRVEDAEFDLECQIEVVRHQVECLNCSAEVGIPLQNVPALDLIHYGTGPLATAFGSQMILREGHVTGFEPAVHTPQEALSREYGRLITYHCCMRYDTHFQSIIKTDGFIGLDAGMDHNDLDKIEAALVQAKGIWMRPLGPKDMDVIKRLRGKVGMMFSVSGSDRADAICQARHFLSNLPR